MRGVLSPFSDSGVALSKKGPGGYHVPFDQPLTEAKGMEAELLKVRDIVNGATLSESARHTAGWCLDRLPGLYREFLQSFDQRYSDEIRRLVQGLLKNVGKEPLARSIAEQFRSMHESLGLPNLELTPGTPARKKKAS
jgi:hypothetical protein